MELLMGQMAAHPLGLPILHSHMNSYNGLYSLYFGKVHAAAAGVFAEDITPLLPGIPLALLTLYEFTLGLYIKEGNPKDISGIQDLTRKDIILANREKAVPAGSIWINSLRKCRSLLLPYPDIRKNSFLTFLPLLQ